jgi:hypothetical protein
VSNLSLVPVPSEPAASACANCGAPLLADQRYCLSCGQPVSPVRLAFLDVLESDRALQPGAAQQAFGMPGAIDVGPVAYVPVAGDGVNGWLRRYSGLLSLLSVLALCLLVGLLVGHWVTQGNGEKAPAKQVVEIKGLSGLTAASAAPTSTGSEATETETGKPASKQEKKEAEEGEHETKAEKAPPPPAKKVTKSKLKKLSSTTGRKHQEEINALGDEPIETG